MIDDSIHHRDKTIRSGTVGFINLRLSDYMPILFVLLQITNAHNCLTEFLSTTLNCPVFNNTAYSTFLPNILTTNISGYTAIVAIHSVDIATASHML